MQLEVLNQHSNIQIKGQSYAPCSVKAAENSVSAEGTEKEIKKVLARPLTEKSDTKTDKLIKSMLARWMEHKG